MWSNQDIIYTYMHTFTHTHTHTHIPPPAIPRGGGSTDTLATPPGATPRVGAKAGFEPRTLAAATAPISPPPAAALILC